jgi:hypothetical protein
MTAEQGGLRTSWVIVFGAAMGWLEAVVVVGIVYSLLVSGNLVAAAQLLLIGLVAGGFAVVIFRHTEGSVGTITRDGVTVERAPAILGARFPGPVGRFTLSQFAKVRAEEAFGPIGTSYAPRPHARIYLAGAAGAPDILIARVPDVGVGAGREIATALNLPFEDKHVAY